MLALSITSWYFKMVGGGIKLMLYFGVSDSPDSCWKDDMAPLSGPGVSGRVICPWIQTLTPGLSPPLSECLSPSLYHTVLKTATLW